MKPIRSRAHRGIEICSNANDRVAGRHFFRRTPQPVQKRPAGPSRWGALHARTPASAGTVLRWYLQLHYCRKDQTTDDGDVGHRQGLSGDERMLFQHVVEVAHPSRGFVTLTEPPFGVPINLDVGSKPWRAVMEVDTDRVEQFELGGLAHHVDQAIFERCPAGKRWCSVERIELFGNGRALGNEGSVVEFEHRHGARLILLRDERGLFVLPL
jgi:hypothetical protein